RRQRGGADSTCPAMGDVEASGRAASSSHPVASTDVREPRSASIAMRDSLPAIAARGTRPALLVRQHVVIALTGTAETSARSKTKWSTAAKNNPQRACAADSHSLIAAKS